MSGAAQASIGSHCLRKQHDHCLIPLSCACGCHSLKLAPPPGSAEPAPKPNAAGKYKPVIALEWGDPPPVLKPKTSSIISSLVPELKRHPGEWAKVGTWRSPNSAATAANPLRKAHPDIEFTSRRLDDGGSALFARAKPE